jgi:hypothetical protein
MWIKWTMQILWNLKRFYFVHIVHLVYMNWVVEHTDFCLNLEKHMGFSVYLWCINSKYYKWCEDLRWDICGRTIIHGPTPSFI